MGLLTRFFQRRRVRKVTSLRDNAVEYISLLDNQMKTDGVKRSERRRFKRELGLLGGLSKANRKKLEGILNA